MASAPPPRVVVVDSLQGLVPKPPFDETPITPAETVGAVDDGDPGRSMTRGQPSAAP